MLRRSLISLLMAVALLVLLAAAVGAQSASDDPAADAPSIEPMGASIVQAVPLTLTINIPGPDGMQTVEVPIVLSLDIRIALGNVLSTTVVVTPEVAAPVEPAPTKAPPTPTPAPPTATPTAAAPTPRPVGQTPTAEPEETAEVTPAPEEEATPEGTEGQEAVIEPESCTDPRSVIFAPAANDVISGTVEVDGTANHERFSYYKLEYAQVGGEYAFIMDSKEKVIDGLLAKLDTTELDNGMYVLRLTVVDNTGNFPPQCSVPVEIAN